MKFWNLLPIPYFPHSFVSSLAPGRGNVLAPVVFSSSRHQMPIRRAFCVYGSMVIIDWILWLGFECLVYWKVLSGVRIHGSQWPCFLGVIRCCFSSVFHLKCLSRGRYQFSSVQFSSVCYINMRAIPSLLFKIRDTRHFGHFTTK